jgi:putative tryptophan/tyrosine transport system substrate-binding protein
MAATSEIPIVFGFGGDPVQQGVVASLSRPGGNVTGMASMSGELVGKQLDIFHELLPQASRFGILSNPNNLVHEVIIKDAQSAAAAIGGSIDILTATSDAEIDAVFAELFNNKTVHGLLVSNDLLYLTSRS